jgi:hypothetical protein
LKKLSILFVDDEPAVTDALTQYFGQTLGCGTVSPSNGNDTVDLL